MDQNNKVHTHQATSTTTKYNLHKKEIILIYTDRYHKERTSKARGGGGGGADAPVAPRAASVSDILDNFEILLAVLFSNTTTTRAIICL